ncbi:hypothetical protein H0O01_05520 [Candidatus Micrarchaeota archaeon]|nr:hypothetical protein [Candidatus Micrarchaeota archaeon]
MAGEKPGPDTKKLFKIPPPTRTPKPPQPMRQTPPEFRKIPEHAGTDTGETMILNPRVPVKMVRPDADEGKIPVDVRPAEERKPVGGMELETGPLMAMLRSAVNRRSDFNPAEFAQRIRRAFRCREGKTDSGASYISIEMENADRFRLYGQQANSASVEKGMRCKHTADLTVEGELLSLYREMPELETGPLAALFRSAVSYRSGFDPAEFAQGIRRAFRCGEGETGSGTSYILIEMDDARLFRLYGQQANSASVEKGARCRPVADLRAEGELRSLYWETPEMKQR